MVVCTTCTRRVLDTLLYTSRRDTTPDVHMHTRDITQYHMSRVEISPTRYEIPDGPYCYTTLVVLQHPQHTIHLFYAMYYVEVQQQVSKYTHQLTHVETSCSSTHIHLVGHAIMKSVLFMVLGLLLHGVCIQDSRCVPSPTYHTTIHTTNPMLCSTCQLLSLLSLSSIQYQV